jgi:RimJ/RimL family protein N-acetyltransferase
VPREIPKVRLRALEREDLAKCVEWIADPEVRENLLFRFPMSMAEEEKWFEGYLKRLETDRIFAIETLKGKYIGNVGIHRIDHLNRHAEVGIFIGEKSFWDKGYGTDALKAALRLAFDELNLHKVYLAHFEDNWRAHKCYKKCGFQVDGVLRDHVFKRGRFHSQTLMCAINPREHPRARRK